MAVDAWGKPYLARLEAYYTNARWWALAFAVASVAVGGYVWKALNLPLVRRWPLMQLEISLGGRSISVTGMVDTGNDLRDPVSGLPVVVVDWDSLKHIMPQEVSHFFLSAWDMVSTRLTESEIGKRLRLIPYTNVSGHRQILPAFKPDALYLTGKHGRFQKSALVGVAGKPLSPRGLYQAPAAPRTCECGGRCAGMRPVFDGPEIELSRDGHAWSPGWGWEAGLAISVGLKRCLRPCRRRKKATCWHCFTEGSPDVGLHSLNAICGL